MRVSIRAPRENRKGYFRLNLWVPLGIAGWRFIWRFVPEEAKPYTAITAEVVRALKEFKRENGPWNLVEVDSPDNNTHVVIRV